MEFEADLMCLKLKFESSSLEHTFTYRPRKIHTCHAMIVYIHILPEICTYVYLRSLNTQSGNQKCNSNEDIGIETDKRSLRPLQLFFIALQHM